VSNHSCPSWRRGHWQRVLRNCPTTGNRFGARPISYLHQLVGACVQASARPYGLSRCRSGADLESGDFNTSPHRTGGERLPGEEVCACGGALWRAERLVRCPSFQRRTMAEGGRGERLDPQDSRSRINRDGRLRVQLRLRARLRDGPAREDLRLSELRREQGRGSSVSLTDSRRQLRPCISRECPMSHTIGTGDPTESSGGAAPPTVLTRHQTPSTWGEPIGSARRSPRL